MNRPQSGSAVRYGVALAGLAAAVLLRAAFHPILGETNPLLTIWAAIALAEWFSGYKPAVLVTVLGYAASSYFFIEPYRDGPYVTADYVRLFAFALNSAVIIAFGEAMRTAQRRYLKEQQGALEDKRRLDVQADALRLSELNNAIMANMGEGLFTVDANGLVTYMNRAAEEHFGWSRGELIGKKMHELTHYKHVDGSPFPIEECAGFKVLREGAVLVDYEDWFIRKDGSFFPVSYCSSPLHAGSETVGLVVVFRDTTQQRKGHDRLMQLAAELSEADRRKDEFLATLAHELRNPLAPIRTGFEVIRLAGGDWKLVTQARTMMERQFQQLVHLVDDLLDVSRITRGRLELRTERVELSSVINALLETSRPAIESSGQELIVSLPETPVYLEADITRLGQIFANLLNNAAKYSEPGGRITLTAQIEGEEIVVRVRDTGLGIPPEMLPHIFDMFTQVDASLERSQGGLGIGLTIVKRLVEKHGGSVQAASEGRGAGSEFTVRLPILPRAAGPYLAARPAEPPPHVTQPSRVLVADDNEDAATSLAMMLRLLGHEVATVRDGLEAVDAASVFRPDVILLDIGMPRLNGYDACRRIRQQSGGDKTMIIAVSGWGQNDDKQLSKEAGFDHHLVKPVDPLSLGRLLAPSKPTTA